MSDSGANKEGTAKTPKVREEANPVPREFVGQTKTGIISDVLKTKIGNGQFGFILVGGDVEKANAPRIYFNMTDFSDAEFRPRKGYGVSFTVTEDESARMAAKNVTLTADGKVTAAAREKEIAERASAAPKSTGSPGAAKPKAKRTRQPRPEDTRTVNLKVSSVGATGEKDVVAKLGESLGKLKHLCISAFESEDITLQVYHSDGRLLSKEILVSMKDGDSVRLGPKSA